jgi:uncharacterized RDD family membrane protein YckC
VIFQEIFIGKIVVEMNHLADFLKKVELPLHLITYFILIVIIAYGQTVSDKIKSYGPNVLFRLFAFGAVVAISILISPLHALLAALIIALFVSFTPGYNTESFENTKVMAKKKHRWYDEEVLSENPTLIQSDRVLTLAPNT